MAITATTTLAERTASWDKIGADISAAKSIKDALTLSGLGFTVEKQPIYTAIGDTMSPIEGWCSAVGTDGKVRGVVKESYEIINNAEAFTLADALHDEGNLEYIRGGETYKGMSYLIMALPEFKVLEDDIKLYFILQNSFGGQQATKAAIAPLRIVCQNQFRVAFRDAHNSVSVRHTSTAQSRLDQARQMLGYAGKYITEFQKYAEKLVSIKVTRSQIDQFVDAMFPCRSEAEVSIERNDVLRGDFYNCYAADDLANFKGTAWGLLNAWQDYETHTVGFKPKAQAADYKFMQLANSGSNKAVEVLGDIIKVAA